MNSRVMIYLIIAVIACIAVLIGMNVAGAFGLMPAKYVTPNEVKGVSIEHNDKMYTLNFEQQRKVVDILNRTIKVNPEEAQKVNHTLPIEVTKIVLYKFNGDDVNVQIVGYIGNDSKNPTDRIVTMVFSIPQWNKSSLLEESFPNEMLKVLSTSFDKDKEK